MSSSTSSSRGIFLRVFGVVLVGMALAMGLVRVITYLNDVSGDTILARVVEARAALPKIVSEEQDLVLVFGSSMTHAGFSARQFDRELAEHGIDVKSFNLGFGGLNPFFQDYLARRIREAFDEAGRRPKLSLIEFTPFQLTQSRWRDALPTVDSFVGMLASPKEIWDLTLEDPARGVRVANIHYLRDDISAEMTTWYFGEALHPEQPRSSLPLDEAAEERLDELGDKLTAAFEEEYPDYAGENWHYGWQGAGTIPEERSATTLEIFEDYYDAQRHPRRLENDKLNRVQCCDIEELHFEETLVEAFIRMVKTFQQFSDHTEVILLPRNNEWIRYSPEAEARLGAVLARVALETGVTIRNYQDLDGFDTTMFSDTTHLSRYAGDVAFTSHLVEQYAPALAGAVEE